MKFFDFKNWWKRILIWESIYLLCFQSITHLLLSDEFKKLNPPFEDIERTLTNLALFLVIHLPFTVRIKNWKWIQYLGVIFSFSLGLFFYWLSTWMGHIGM